MKVNIQPPIAHFSFCRTSESDRFLLFAVLGTFLASLNTFIAEEYRLQHHVSEYYVYDFMKVSTISLPFCLHQCMLILTMLFLLLQIWRCSQTEGNENLKRF